LKKNLFMLRILAVLLISGFLLTLSYKVNGLYFNKSDDFITLVYSFDEPVVEKIDGYDHITINGLYGSGAPGEPYLPSKGISVVLPLHTKLKDITVRGESYTLGYGFKPMIVDESQPVSNYVIESDSIIMNSESASSDGVYPGVLFSNNGVYSFRGFSILVMTLYPVQYVASTGEIRYYTRLTVTISLESDHRFNPLLRGLREDTQVLYQRGYYNNLYPLNDDESPSSTLSDTYDLLIITDDSLRESFLPLAEKHNETGVRTIIKTLSEIGSTAEEIRDFIRNEYVNHGIDYVLLGGDTQIIPAKQLYFGRGDTGEDVYGPSDLYYSCLDGDFDGNGNGILGEPDDDVDMLAEVYVGRAPVDDQYETEIFVYKTIRYIDSGILSNNTYIGRVLLVGEKLQSNPDTYGDDSMEELVDGSSNNGYTTRGVPSNRFQIYRLYERVFQWSEDDIVNMINKGVYLVSHLGHGNYYNVMKLTNSSIYSLVNSKTFLLYSQACNAGGFDKSDCIIEYLTVKTPYGAFAAIANSREGWYTPGGTNGPSQRYNREFYDALFNESITDPSMRRISIAFQDSKEDNLHVINLDRMRWCYYSLNLFGDPALLLYDPAPQPVINIKNVDNRVGFIQAVIENSGVNIASEIEWSIQVKGGFLKFINKTRNGVIDKLESEENITVNSRLLFGMGRVTIIVSVNIKNEPSIMVKRNMLILGFLIIDPLDHPYIFRRQK